MFNIKLNLQTIITSIIMISKRFVAIFMLVINASYSLAAVEKEMPSSQNPEQFSVKEIVDYECVKSINLKFQKLLCSALNEHLLTKGAEIKSGKHQSANGIHVRIILEMVTDDSISGWMEWTRCKDTKCSSWIKTDVIQTIVMDSMVIPLTYRDFIISLFIFAKNQYKRTNNTEMKRLVQSVATTTDCMREY